MILLLQDRDGFQRQVSWHEFPPVFRVAKRSTPGAFKTADFSPNINENITEFHFKGMLTNDSAYYKEF